MSVFDVITGRYIHGAPAEAILKANVLGKTSVTILDDRAGDKGVLVEIGTVQDDVLRVRVIRGEAG